MTQSLPLVVSGSNRTLKVKLLRSDDDSKSYFQNVICHSVYDAGELAYYECGLLPGSLSLCAECYQLPGSFLTTREIGSTRSTRDIVVDLVVDQFRSRRTRRKLVSPGCMSAGARET